MQDLSIREARVRTLQGRIDKEVAQINILKKREAIMNVREFDERFCALSSGDSMIYHVGFLMTDRENNQELHDLAEAAQETGLDQGYVVWTRNRKQYQKPALDLAHLTQRKIAEGVYEYIITKK